MSHHNSMSSHLGENEILQAVVDETDLSQHLKQHLNECSHCRLQKERFAQELARLGQLARRYAPEPQRRVTLAAPAVVLRRRCFNPHPHAAGDGVTQQSRAVRLMFQSTPARGG